MSDKRRFLRGDFIVVRALTISSSAAFCAAVIVIAKEFQSKSELPKFKLGQKFLDWFNVWRHPGEITIE
jgi:hypothetical protein